MKQPDAHEVTSRAAKLEQSSRRGHLLALVVLQRAPFTSQHHPSLGLAYLVVSLGVDRVGQGTLECEGTDHTVSNTVVEDSRLGCSLLGTRTTLGVLVDTGALDNVDGACEDWR